MGVVTATETPSAEDQAVCLRALNGLLKELPVYGYQWPEYKEGALSWSGLTPSTVALPTDFYGFPTIRRGDGERLVELSPAEWLALPDRTETAEKPTHFYVSGASVTLWPIPTADPVLTCAYQGKVSDADGSTVPDIPQSWYAALAWGIAYECRLKFQLPADLRAEIAGEWKERRAYLLASACPTGPIEFTVAD